MSHTPKISCIVALYNKGSCVKQTLHSLMSQTMTNWEAIVVDDGSTDHGPEIVRDLARLDKRITLITQPNSGVSSARNAGLDAARGEFIHILDADDLLYPNSFATLLSAVRDDVDGATGAYDVCSTDGRRLATPSRASEIVDLDDMICRGTIWTCSHIVRKSAIGSLRFRKRFEPFEDADMWINLAEQGVRWRYIRERVAMYVIQPSSASKQALRYLKLSEECMVELFDRQRALGPARRLSDISEERLEVLLGESALRYATRAVVQGGPESISQVADCYASARGARSIPPGRAAETGRSAVIHGLGRLPMMNQEPIPQWQTTLDIWWKLLESSGWGEKGMAEGAWFVMRTLRVPPMRVCNAILERVGPVGELTLVGIGQNGRLLAEEALSRGYRVYVRDDRYPDGVLPEQYVSLGLLGEPIDAKPIRPVVITPLDDVRIVPRFAECKPLRWHNTLMDLAKLSWAPDVVETEVREQSGQVNPLPWPEPVGEKLIFATQ